MNEYNPNSLVFAPRTPQILMSLLDSPASFSVLQKVVGGSNSTIERRINDLVKAKLIFEKRENHLPFRRWLYLTNDGRKIARGIAIVVDLLSKMKFERGALKT